MVKFKKLAIAAALVSASLSASASFTNPVFVSGTSFNDVTLGTITIGSLSNIVGQLDFASETKMFGTTINLNSVIFSGSSLTSGSTITFSGDHFAASNLAAGSYILKASGSISTGSIFPGALIAASYNVTPVPEPESYAMFLAGLGIMGAVVRRRSNKA